MTRGGGGGRPPVTMALEPRCEGNEPQGRLGDHTASRGGVPIQRRERRLGRVAGDEVTGGSRAGGTRPASVLRTPGSDRVARGAAGGTPASGSTLPAAEEAPKGGGRDPMQGLQPGPGQRAGSAEEGADRVRAAEAEEPGWGHRRFPEVREPSSAAGNHLKGRWGCACWFRGRVQGGGTGAS